MVVLLHPDLASNTLSIISVSHSDKAIHRRTEEAEDRHRRAKGSPSQRLRPAFRYRSTINRRHRLRLECWIHTEDIPDIRCMEDQG
jgi:hypothetical protein